MLASLLLALGPILHARPLGDDLCNAAKVAEAGFVGCVRNDYLEWGGRWASTLLACGFPALLDVGRGYPAALLAVAGVLALALRALASTLLDLRDHRRLAWLLALLFLALYWAGMPHPGESLYWLEGSYIYSLNLALSLLLVTALLRLPARAPGVGTSAGLVVLAGFVAAFHELFALVLLAVLATGGSLALRFRDPRARAWGAAAAGTMLGLATVVLAPGNESREATFPEGRSAVRAVLAALQMWARVLDAPVARGEAVGSITPLGWLVDPRLLAATVLLATSPRIRSLDPAWLRRDARLWRAVVPAVWLAALTGSFLAGGWALGRTLPLRAFNGLYLVFLLGWFLTVLVWARGPGPEARGTTTALLRVASALVLSVGLLVSTNSKLALRDLADGRSAHFAREMARREAEAARVRQQGGTELVVRRVEPWPSSYFRADVADLAPALRQCVARHFGVASLRVEP